MSCSVFCIYLFVDIPAVAMPFRLTPLSFGIPCGASFACTSPDYLPSGSSILWHYVPQDSRSRLR